MVIFNVKVVFIGLEQKTNFSLIQKYVKKKKFFCDVVIPSEETKMEFN